MVLFPTNLKLGIKLALILIIYHYYVAIFAGLLLTDLVIFGAIFTLWFYLIIIKRKDINTDRITYRDSFKNWFPSIDISNLNASGSKVVIGAHPYGLTHATLMTIPGLDSFKIVVNSIVSSLSGGWHGVYEEEVRNTMRRQENFIIYPGGIREVAYYNYQEHHIHVPDDFIRWVLHYGYTLRPCYVFSESSMYVKYTFADDEIKFAESDNMWLNIIAYLSAIPLGWFFTTPKKTPVFVAFGSDLGGVQKVNPSAEDVAALKQEYIVSLQKLFADNIDKFTGKTSKELIIH